MDTKRILILGGTSVLGPAITAAALARGHTVTLFNRGRMEDARDLTFPDGVDVRYGHRDPAKTADHTASATHASPAPVAAIQSHPAASPSSRLATPYMPTGKTMLHRLVS